MRVKLEQLTSYLEQEKCSSVYVIFGEEPLLIEEAADQIRRQAHFQGFKEREVLHGDRGFDWGRLQQAVEGLSLFATRRLIELRLPTGMPGERGAPVLQACARRIGGDTRLLLIGGRWERRLQSAKWFTTLERLGIVVQVPKVEPASLPRWIERRFRDKGVRATAKAVLALAERVEGNLLACAQEIDRLALLYPAGMIDVRIVEETVTDSARYDAFRLMESALAGDVARLSRILEGLRTEGVEVTAVLGALAWELRRLARIATMHTQGVPLERALEQHRLWGRRQTLSKQALGRHAAPRWQIFLYQLSEIDRMAKGVSGGRSWEAIFQLCLAIAGIELFPWGERN